MAVLIKDKDLPPSCAKCMFAKNIEFQKDDAFASFYGCELENNISIPLDTFYQRRAIWCPLVRG